MAEGLPSQMKAGVYYAPGDVRIETRPVPRPGPGELVLRVRACGLCGTDLAKYRHQLVEPATVLGHEVTGEVAALGEGVDRFQVGDRVLVPHHVPCFTCVYCRHGSYSMCADWKPGQIAPGGFCEYMLASTEGRLGVDARVVHLPDTKVRVRCRMKPRRHAGLAEGAARC